MTPRRGRLPSGNRIQFATRHPVAIRCPSFRIRPKSRPVLSLAARPKRREPAPMPGHLDRGEAFTADAAAVAQDGASALARVSAPEAVLPFPADFRWLILSLHKPVNGPAASD